MTRTEAQRLARRIPGAVLGRRRKPGVATYDAIHARLNVSQGPAKVHKCVKCKGQAYEWAYDGKDPDETRNIHAHGYMVLYSQKLEHYRPMCRLCHRALDAERRRNEAKKHHI